MSAADIRRALELAVRDELAPLGFKKRQGGIYTCDFEGGFIGWVSLPDSATGWFSVRPKVAVRCQALHRLLEEIKGNKYHPYIPPTVGTDIGWPDRNRVDEWDLYSPHDARRVAQEIAAKVLNHSLPWMKRHATLESLIRLLEETRADGDPGQSRKLAVAYWMAGRVKDTDTLLKKWETYRRPGGKLGWPDFNRFARRLRQRMATEPVPNS